MAKKAVKKEEAPKTDLASLTKERDRLIKSIFDAGLLTNRQLKRGGSFIRGKHLQEKGYELIIEQINDLGKKIGQPRIGLGTLRK